MSLWTTRTTSILVLCAAVGAYGCGSSPTGPKASTPAGDGLPVVFMDATGVLSGKEEMIRQHIQATFDRAAKEISLDGLVVEITPGPQFVIPGWGLGGKAFNDRRVQIDVDPDLSPQLIDERLPSIAAHEFHHVARGRGPGYGNRLLQAMVSEGMADHFALELFGRPPPPWAVVLSEEEIPIWIENARPEFDSKRYSHSVWFFGTGWVPRWTGYTVGFELIGRYKEVNPGSSAATLVTADADLFRP